MAVLLEQIEWEGCLVEPRPDDALEAYSKKHFGIVPPGLPYLAPVPWMAKVAIELHPELGLLMHLDGHVADLLVLVVSQENSCRYCYAAARAMLWLHGMERERILRVEQDMARADLEPRVRKTLDFGRLQSRRGPEGAREGWRQLRRAGFSADEMKEIAFTVATTDLSNRMNSIPAIPSRPLERMPQQLHMRLLRPLVSRMLRKHRWRGQAAPAPAAAALPFAGLVEAYAGSPIAPALLTMLRSMWDSPVLTRRCKLLMLAVIARGLPCALCESELVRLGPAEDLPAELLQQALTHLDAPGLSGVERQLMAFARETIWYEPAVLQRRARDLRGQLSDVQLLEAIGVAAVGNGLVRMAAVVREDPQ